MSKGKDFLAVLSLSGQLKKGGRFVGNVTWYCLSFYVALLMTQQSAVVLSFHSEMRGRHFHLGEDHPDLSILNKSFN